MIDPRNKETHSGFPWNIPCVTRQNLLLLFFFVIHGKSKFFSVSDLVFESWFRVGSCILMLSHAASLFSSVVCYVTDGMEDKLKVCFKDTPLVIKVSFHYCTLFLRSHQNVPSPRLQLPAHSSYVLPNSQFQLWKHLLSASYNTGILLGFLWALVHCNFGVGLTNATVLFFF